MIPIISPYTGRLIPTVSTFAGSSLGNFSGSNKVISATNQLQAFNPGNTLWFIFKSTAYNAINTETVIGCNTGSLGAGKGWWLSRASTLSGAGEAGRFYFLTSGAHFTGLLPRPPINGITVMCMVWRASDNVVLCSQNGSPFVITGVCAPATNAIDSTCQSSIGTDNGTGFAAQPCTSGSVAAYAIWSREATSTEAIANTFTTGNRFVLSAAVQNDATCTVNFNAKRDWNGVASTITTLGSAPVTFNVTGSPTLTKLDEIRYTATNQLAHDSKRVLKLIGTNNYKYTARDSFARFSCTTSALNVGFEAYSTLFGSFGGPQSAVGVSTNGVYVSEVTMEQHAKPQLFNANPGAGSSKIVHLSEGPQNMSSGTDRTGTFIQAIRVPIYLDDGVTLANSSIRRPTAPQKRLVILGDSILTGFYGLPVQQNTAVPLLRADFPTSGTGGVTGFLAGTDSILNLANTTDLANTNAALLASELDGTVSNTLWIGMGTNDYGYYAQSLATFTTNYARFLDAIHAASPGTLIYCQTPIQRIAPGSEAANASGNTLTQYRTAIGTVVSTRTSFCTLIDGAAGAIVSNGNMYTDGIHITTAGCAQYKAFIKTTLGY